MTSKEFKEDFIGNSIYRLDESMRMVSKCFDQLSNEEVWKRPNNSTNTIGNLTLHLCGNIRQYAISSLGRTKDVRNRDSEFVSTEPFPKMELLNMLQDTVNEAKVIIRKADEAELLRKRSVQGFNFTGMGIIIHVTEHFSYHTGQIALLTKLWKNEDLGFYDGFDLNTKNEQ